jgi:hypothetical protein
MTPPLVAAALELQRCLQHAAIPACIIGGLAVQRWGERRATQDVDITVLAPPGDEAGAIDVLLSAFTPRQDDARAFALRHRVLLLRAGNGVPLDVALAGSPFEREVLDRASQWPMAPDAVLRPCAAENMAPSSVN